MGINDPGNLPSTPLPCLINLADIYSGMKSPITRSDFLTPGYVDPTDTEPSAWSIKIYYSPTQFKQFTWFYMPETMRIQGNFGQQGAFQFGIDDSVREDMTGLPFQLTEELYVVIQNYQETYTYAAGYVRKCPKRVTDGLAREDGSEMGYYQVQCTDLYHELERKTVKRSYSNVKLGFLIKDVIQRYTRLDASLIDPTAGITIGYKRFTTQTPAQVLEWALGLMDWTFVLYPDTRQIRLADKTQGTVRIPVPGGIVDDTVYEYFDMDTFELSKDNENIKNRIELIYNEIFNLGLVNVVQSPAIGADVVVAHASNTVDWTSIPPGVDFYIGSGASLYRVEKNLTNFPVKQLQLSSAYKETSTTDLGKIRGFRRTRYFSDWLSINFFKQVRGDDGVFTLTLSEDTNNFTPEEAIQFGTAQLALAQPLPHGRATTTNDGFPFFVREGYILFFDLDKRKKFTGDVTIQSIVLQDIGGEIDPEESPDGAWHPKLAVELGFTPVFVGAQAQARKTAQDLRKIYINDLAEDVQQSQQLPELIAVKDCIHVNRTEVHTGLYKTNSAYTTDLNHYSFTST